MMMRAICITACLVSGAAMAAERPLTAAETTALIAGNTALGTGSGGATKQFFNPNGDTDYIAGDGSASKGRWRMQGDQYCSVWPPADRWACYAVKGDPEATPPVIIWVDTEGFESRATVTAGNELK